MKNKSFISVAELAKLLGISRIAVFKRIKKGQISAQKIGRSYAVSMDDVNEITKGNNKPLTEKQKDSIEKAVRKVVKEYGKTLQLLGKE